MNIRSVDFIPYCRQHQHGTGLPGISFHRSRGRYERMIRTGRGRGKGFACYALRVAPDVSEAPRKMSSTCFMMKTDYQVYDLLT